MKRFILLTFLTCVTTTFSFTGYTQVSNYTCSSSTAIFTDWLDVTNSTTKVETIKVYVESDFAQEMNSCSVNESNISSIVPLVRSAINVWNRESRGPVFSYAGQLSYDSPQSLCNFSSSSRYLYITFRQGYALDHRNNNICARLDLLDANNDPILDNAGNTQPGPLFKNVIAFADDLNSDINLPLEMAN